ncbi:epidermal growth factor receptor kinase substrate 8-like protein 3 isoform X2 [Xenopus laevis]|uniref:Epidermal growth factor receptor kinase substrate 8-like protein 3 isoform X2 n=1 Tax=Xenopus laevis TaxID=8355 RepID=A0A8J0TX29_XENLA|nr:epidermal growth factor receptor kinase substrate 8-like protein 3 isoform X2 [Xenopus laevis]
MCCTRVCFGVLAQHEGLTRSRSISRPTAKNIYQQRKEYVQSLSTAVTNFQHRVEHLLTCDLDNERRNVEDCLKHLSFLEAQGRVWGQGLILQLDNGEILLKDPETKDNLEQVPLKNVENCSSLLGGSTYNSLLTIKVQSQQKKSIFFFQCDEQPADVLHTNLEKALKQFRLNIESKDTNRYNLENSQPQNSFLERSQSPHSSGDRHSPRLQRQHIYPVDESPIQQRRFKHPEEFHAPPRAKPPLSFQPSPVNSEPEPEHDIEVLNHVLCDIELFVGKLNIDKKKKKATFPDSEFVDCLQKVKYAFILLGNVHKRMQQPSAPDLIHLVMDTLAKIVGKCPRKDLPPSVVSPLLTEKALMLLSSCVTDKEKKFWESLGVAWMKTRAEWPNGKNIPQYVPTFSDGWVIPDIPFSDVSSQKSRSPETPLRNRQFQPLLKNVLHDFEARNNRELSVRKGNIVKVLDQSRQWWMVQNSQGQQGFVPNNILENTDDDQAPINSVVLNPGSRPEEVKVWLQQKGFSNITVRCLGVLRGDQLLELSRDDLKAVCPEEGGRVHLQLRTVGASLGT